MLVCHRKTVDRVLVRPSFGSVDALQIAIEDRTGRVLAQGVVAQS
jgi:hypothetical protein